MTEEQRQKTEDHWNFLQHANMDDREALFELVGMGIVLDILGYCVLPDEHEPGTYRITKAEEKK